MYMLFCVQYEVERKFCLAAVQKIVATSAHILLFLGSTSIFSWVLVLYLCCGIHTILCIYCI
jgi:hypothetical protein